MITFDHSSRISDVDCVYVGHYTDPVAQTGCTVILFDKSCPAAVHVAGGAPGSSETDLLKSAALMEGIDAILLSGGSAYGLEAAGGVRRFLEEKGRGFPAGNFKVPIVPTAVIFDLATGDGKKRPGPEEGYKAIKNAFEGGSIEEGSIGAGTGARVAKYLGMDNSVRAGLASGSVTFDDGIKVGALMVSNCFGAIIDPVSGKTIAAPKREDGSAISYLESNAPSPKFGNTAIGVVVTNVALTKSEAKRVAIMAHDGLARVVTPSHTPYDGDTIFVVSTGDKKAEVAKVGAWAAELVAATIVATVKK